MGNVNGRVNGLNNNVYDTLKEIKSKNKGALNPNDATKIAQAVKQDNKIDAAEEDLLVELTQNNVRSIRVSSSKNPANTVSFGTAVGKTQKMLQETLIPTSELEKLSGQGAAGIKKLVSVYQRSPADAERVVKALAKKGAEAWEKSAVTNAYAPLRDMISASYSGVKALEGESHDAGRDMLHQSIKQIDLKKGDAIPDFLYNWIRPGGRI